MDTNKKSTLKWLSVCLVLSFILNSTPTLLRGQSPEVNSGSFQVMLKALLDHSVPEISVEDAAKVQESSVFLDAREPSEYEVSHIADAQLVGYDHFDIKTIASIPKDQPIIVYCSVGYRSEKISEQLLAAGYQDVCNLYGGLFEWKNKDYQVVDDTNESTESVHAYNRTWGIWLKKGVKVYTK